MVSDEAIVDLYWERSESAISETAKKYGNYCYVIANNILRNNEDAEECVNGAYLKAWGAIPPERPVIFRSFLGKITRNLSLDKYQERTTKKRGGGEVSLLLSELEDCIPSSSNLEAEYESKLVIEAINSCLHAMTSESRIIFVRRYWYADSIKSIASHFMMSESKVKSLLFRTRRNLKINLEKRGVKV